MLRNFTVLAAVIVLAVTVHAQEQAVRTDNLSFHAGVGAGYGLSQFGRLVDYGYQGEFGVQFRPFAETPEASLVLSASYHRFPNTQGAAADITVLSGVLDFKFTPTFHAASRFYVLGGIGYGRVALQNPPDGAFLAYDITAESQPLAEAGLGIEYVDQPGVDFYIEAKAVNVLSSKFGDYRFIKMSFGVLF